MKRLISQIGCGGWIILTAVLLVVLAITYDKGRRYFSWSNLSKAELVASADWYIQDRAPNHRACLYAVVCEGGRARLELIKDLDEWDIDTTKNLVWDRRFRQICEGRTANFALGVEEGGPEIPAHTKRAIWSFSNNRFVPAWGRFHGPHAFSEGNVEPCTAEYVITGQSSATAAP